MKVPHRGPFTTTSLVLMVSVNVAITGIDVGMHILGVSRQIRSSHQHCRPHVVEACVNLNDQFGVSTY